MPNPPNVVNYKTPKANWNSSGNLWMLGMQIDKPQQVTEFEL